MTNEAFLETYETPMTVDRAFSFGARSGYGNHDLFTFTEFMGDTIHPYPQSLYRAYEKGHAAGQEQRAAADAAREAEQ